MTGQLNHETIQGNEVPDLWDQYHSNRAKEFISNIVFIDDRPYIQPENDQNSTQEAAEKDTTEDDAFGHETQEEETDQGPLIISDVGGQDSHELRVRELSSQFAKMGIATSFLFPEASQDEKSVIAETQNISNFADIVVLDWHLRDGKPTLTLKILKDLLESDENENGRMRLICIYTGEQPEPIPKIVFDELKEKFEALTLEDERIQGPNLKIFVLKKDKIEPSSLADRLIAEFSVMAEGLMPSFALSAVTVLRKNTHHLLSVFSKELDPAIVGHRMQLADSDDVETFGLDVLVMQLKSLLSTHIVHREALSLGRFESWVSEKLSEKEAVEVTFKNAQDKDVRIPIDYNIIKELMADSFDKTAGKNKYKKVKEEWKKAVHSYIFDSSENQTESCYRMARLSKLVREQDGMLPLPEGWQPTLSLGSILKSRGEDKYWLCTQPICDSVRLKTKRFFPLLKLDLKKENLNDEETSCYWITIKVDGKTKVLSLNPKPKSGDFVEFKPDAVKERILARKELVFVRNDAGKFIFSSLGGSKQYQWIADLESLQAQRAVAEMTAQLNRVGVDEYEALRRGFPK